MSCKVISFQNKSNCKAAVTAMAAKEDKRLVGETQADEDKTDQYISQLRSVSDMLQKVAIMFEVPMKEVISDFTYIAIGNEIVSTLIEDGEGENPDLG